ncbi:Starch-binding associating with outer membrane [Pedobacter steynii]|uniref:Starch-binding associating with outer membrane n=1 Tax=Pedobacter steynii TaxID=430522 RepID=A0A1G9U2W8_9SPHI|nr:RagB/SusD family nutrient uptake outer membrane protein [Pedobacter steynii]NQX40637.1 RagB/SusD family nutrient uptake outer membrane protein [Pedobacter steynii]SDM54183.1 Starch-binding associating with outer membrane [Pedobacter steynii]
MRNQSKYIIIALLSIAISVGGCKKSFLNQEPESGLTDANFWKTESDLKQGVVGAYSSLRGMGTFSYWVFGEMRSDNTTFQYNAPQRGQENRELVDQLLVNSTNTLIQDYWRDCYVAISRCNDVLNNVGRIEMPDAAKSQATGEVKFLRAFHYFNLVRQFGGVPLRLEAIKSPTQAPSKGRASVDEVYGQIITDLTDAANALPEVGSYPASEKGRISKGAANALLGEVYMTQKKFGEALIALRKVTGYSLLSAYKDIFLTTNKNNAESIFEIQYYSTAGTNLSSNFMYQFAPFNSGTAVTNDPGTNLNFNSGWNTPTTDLIAAYEAGDLRKDVSLAEGFTSSAGFVAVPYVKKYNQGFVQPGQTNVNFPVIRYADVMLMIAECLNEQGFVPDGEAFGLLNQIRKRAGLAVKSFGNPIPALNVSNQAEFRTAMDQERKVELAFENHRWYDLVRTGTAIPVLTAHGQREIVKNPSQFPAGSYQPTQNKLLLPIPQREVNLDNLAQNPQ